MVGQDLDGRVVLVSGSGPGLGKSTAAAVLAAGGRAVVTDLDEERARSTAKTVDPDGTRTLALRTDITGDEDCAAAVARIRERFGRLDGMVHVAAYDTAVGGLMDEHSLTDWERSAQVNVAGSLRLTRAAVPLIREGGRGGSVVFIGSTSAVKVRRSSLRMAYGASKAALVAAAHSLCEELGPDGIRANTVAPGFKYGPAVAKYFRDQSELRGIPVEGIADVFREELALRKFATDEDVANTVCFFLSDGAKSITGQTLYVDGGHFLH
ncbi:SDR family oxidoreductase [Streptomyces sp. NPDC005373]|uniref:SDR family oxidoreductase n=1 Tax=unclassified Streptomyces TaxID=2593676 RepID=UPI0033B99574